MKILVTGANGYLGTGIVKELLNRDCEVVAADIKIEAIDPRAERIACDLFGIETPYEFFGRPDVVLHLAWRDGFIHQSQNHILDLPRHYLFIKSMVEAGVKRIAVMGSMHEVGKHEGVVTDDTPTNPTTLYGIAKNALRESINTLKSISSFQLQWIRGFYIISNETRGSSIFSKIAQAEEKGEKKFPFTSGVNQYDFLEYDDFCKYVAAIVCQDRVEGIINCCSGVPKALKDAVEDYIQKNRYHIKLEYGAFPDRDYDTKAIWGDNSKIEQILKL